MAASQRQPPSEPQVTVSDEPGQARLVAVIGDEGFSTRVLLDRGADIGATSWSGTPIAWTSPIGEVPPATHLVDRSWLDAFGGGLLTTCGLRNVGAPSEGHPLHGDYSHRRADLLAVERLGGAADDRVEIKARIVDDAEPGSTLSLDRTIIIWTDRPRIEIIDVTTNLGHLPTAAPILYHVNLGAPFIAPTTRVMVHDRLRIVPRDPESKGQLRFAARGPTRSVSAPEAVFEHVLHRGAPGSATVSSAAGLDFDLEWDTSSMPRLHHWVRRTPGWYVVALEPANCSVLGRAADRRAGRLPSLEPGASRHTRCTMRLTPKPVD